MDRTLDTIAIRLRQTARLAVPIEELIDRDAPFPARPEELADRLRDDPRFLVVSEVDPLQPLHLWPDDCRSAYAAVLREAGLPQTTMVLLRDPSDPAPTAGALDEHVRVSALTLLEADPKPELAVAAERARALVAALTPADGTARSTTPPPGPRTPDGSRGTRPRP